MLACGRSGFHDLTHRRHGHQARRSHRLDGADHHLLDDCRLLRSEALWAYQTAATGDLLDSRAGRPTAWTRGRRNFASEGRNYYDVGLSHDIARGWTVGIDAYYKDIKNLIDEGQFGQALILTPFNYAKGYAEGVELSTTYTQGAWSGYLNFAIARAKGKNIVSSQSLFAPDELAYIADHYIYLDHDQRYSLSGGLTYRWGESDRLSGDVIYGSGLRSTPDGAPPNSGKLAAYEVVNVAYVHAWPKLAGGSLEGRIGVRNLFDKTYLLRDGSGVGVGAPQYGERRTIFGALSYAF